MDTKIISTTLNKIQQKPSQLAEAARPPAVANSRADNEAIERPTSVRDVSTDSEQKPTVEQIDEVVEKLNTQALASSHTLKFSLDEKLGKAIISVVDRETNEVIRQIPPETALKISEAFEQVTSGQLLTELA